MDIYVGIMDVEGASCLKVDVDVRKDKADEAVMPFQ